MPEETTTQATPAPPETPKPEAPQADKQPPVPDTQQGNTEATFTQADLDRIVGERAKRASQSAVSDLLTSLGIDSPDALKTLVDAEKQRQEAELSEAEKLQKQIAQLEQEKLEALALVESAKQERIADSRNAAFKSAAKGALDVDVLLAYAKQDHADALAATVGEDGKVDEDKMQAFIKSLQTSKPSMFGSQGAGSPSNSGGYLHNPKNTDAVKNAREKLKTVINR